MTDDRIEAAARRIYETRAGQERYGWKPWTDVDEDIRDVWRECARAALHFTPPPGLSIADRAEAAFRNHLGMDEWDVAGAVRAAVARMREDIEVEPEDFVPTVLATISIERRRQIEDEGFGPEHDDQWTDGEMAQAASCYADPRVAIRELSGHPVRPLRWPQNWSAWWWKPKSRRRDLIRAAALIVAEIERLDRAGEGKD